MRHKLTRRSSLASALGLAGLAMARVARAAPAPVRIGYQKSGSLVIIRERNLLQPDGIAAQWVEFGSGPP